MAAYARLRDILASSTVASLLPSATTSAQEDKNDGDSGIQGLRWAHRRSNSDSTSSEVQIAGDVISETPQLADGIIPLPAVPPAQYDNPNRLLHRSQQSQSTDSPDKDSVSLLDAVSVSPYLLSSTSDTTITIPTSTPHLPTPAHYQEPAITTSPHPLSVRDSQKPYQKPFALSNKSPLNPAQPSQTALPFLSRPHLLLTTWEIHITALELCIMISCLLILVLLLFWMFIVCMEFAIRYAKARIEEGNLANLAREQERRELFHGHAHQRGSQGSEYGTGGYGYGAQERVQRVDREGRRSRSGSGPNRKERERDREMRWGRAVLSPERGGRAVLSPEREKSIREAMGGDGSVSEDQGQQQIREDWRRLGRDARTSVVEGMDGTSGAVRRRSAT